MRDLGPGAQTLKRSVFGSSISAARPGTPCKDEFTNNQAVEPNPDDFDAASRILVAASAWSP
jgi:hypothetical protein